MEITIRKTGGIGGFHEQLGPVDTGQLEFSVAEEIERAVRSIGFYELPTQLPLGQGRDLSYYKMRIRGDQGDHEVSWDDLTDKKESAGVNLLLRLLLKNGFEFSRIDNAIG
jgi:hypothetical protein